MTPVVERAEIVFHDLGIIRASVRGHDEDGFVFESGGEKLTDGGLLAPVDDLFGDGCSHEVIVEQQPVCALPIDAEILLVIGVDARIRGEIVCDDLPGVFGNPVANLFVGWSNAEMNGTDILKPFKGRVGERVHDAYQPSNLVGVLVVILDVGQTR